MLDLPLVKSGGSLNQGRYLAAWDSHNKTKRLQRGPEEGRFPLIRWVASPLSRKKTLPRDLTNHLATLRGDDPQVSRSLREEDLGVHPAGDGTAKEGDPRAKVPGTCEHN